MFRKLVLKIEVAARESYKNARRIVVFVTGVVVLVIGLLMILTPGPAVIVIPTGLAILATEFVWARRLLKRLKNEVMGVAEAINSKNPSDSNHNEG